MADTSDSAVNMAERPERRNFRVAAAIDFGTHSTGYAWAQVDAGNDSPATREIQFRTQWPDQPVPSAKVLSAVLLDKDERVEYWGHTALAMHTVPGRTLSGPYYYGFKLAFRLGPRTGPAPLPTPAEAAKIAGSYLRHIVEEAIKDITRSGYQENDIRWCLTVPAIWDDYAMSLTRKVAELAGLPADKERLRLVYEPEAAALYCRIRGAHVAGGNLEPDTTASDKGSRYLVVDCGGGTADITAYETDDAGQLEQIGRMAGGVFGSENLNLAFLTEVVADRLGGVDKVVDLGRTRPDALLQLANAWEEHKHRLTASVAKDGSVVIDQPVSIPLPYSVYQAIQNIVPDLEDRLSRRGSDGHIVVRQPELTKLFDGVIDRIIDEVDRQLGEVARQCGPPKGAETILLVGGFAQSRYLQLRLSQHLGNRAIVLVPAASAQAVLAGAVHLCYNPELIRIRRSRYTYGYESYRTFRPGVDPESRKFISGYGQILCEGNFARFVKINQAVPADHAISQVVYPTDPEQGGLEINLVTSTVPNPENVDGCAARGRLVLDISSTAGRPEQQRAVDLTFNFGGAEITVTATERASGRTQTTTISFMRTDSPLLPDVEARKPSGPVHAPITFVEPPPPTMQRRTWRRQHP